MIPEKYIDELNENLDPHLDEKLGCLLFGAACKPIEGVYLLFRDNEVVYVGESKNIIKRIDQHLECDMFFDYNSFTYIKEGDKQKRLVIEKELIQAIKPEYNVAHSVQVKNNNI